MAITAMEILERCRRAGADTQRLREKIGMFRDAAGRMTSSIDGVGSRSTGESDHMATLMGEIDEVERQLRQREREYAVEISAACQLLDALPPMECQVLNRYYVRRETLNAIAVGMGYSYSYVRTLKTSGRDALRQVPEGAVARMLPEWYIETTDTKKRQR